MCVFYAENVSGKGVVLGGEMTRGDGEVRLSQTIYSLDIAEGKWCNYY